jgi:hypothetical protein
MQRKQEPKPSNGWFWVRTGVGPAFVIAGLELMPIYYVTGVSLAYFGFVVLFVDLIYEPWVLARSCKLQIALLSSVLVMACWFTVAVVGETFQLDMISTIRGVDYPAGTHVDGVVWQPELTEIKVVLWNGNKADYEKLDVYVESDVAAIHGIILDDPSNSCHLSAPNIVNGIAYVGGGLSLGGLQFRQNGRSYDFPILASDINRLQCQTIPASSSVAFALVVAKIIGTPGPPTTGIVIGNRSIMLFGPISYGKADPKHVLVHGKFQARFKTIDVDQLITLK